MKTDSITVAPDLLVYQTKTTEDNGTLIWTLSLSKKGEKVLVLDSQKIRDLSDPINNITSFSLENDSYLRTSNLIDAFKDNKDLYVFIYENRGIYFYRYHFTEGVTYKIFYKTHEQRFHRQCKSECPNRKKYMV